MYACRGNWDVEIRRCRDPWVVVGKERYRGNPGRGFSHDPGSLRSEWTFRDSPAIAGSWSPSGRPTGSECARQIRRRSGARISCNSEGTQDHLSPAADRSEEHTSELQSLRHLVCRLLLEKKK